MPTRINLKCCLLILHSLWVYSGRKTFYFMFLCLSGTGPTQLPELGRSWQIGPKLLRLFAKFVQLDSCPFLNNLYNNFHRKKNTEKIKQLNFLHDFVCILGSCNILMNNNNGTEERLTFKVICFFFFNLCIGFFLYLFFVAMLGVVHH